MSATRKGAKESRVMREDRGKRVMEWEGFESRCPRHPSEKGSGICPLCLMERLNKLFCPDCGELRQRHSSASSCSCSEASTSSSDCMKKKSCNSNNGGGGGGSVEVGSVGRISFLIESDRPDFESSKDAASAAILLLRRSKSAAVSTTRTAVSVAAAVTVPQAVAVVSEPRTPKAVLKAKKWYTTFSLVLSKKKRRKAKEGQAKDSGKDSGNVPRLSSASSDRIVAERFVKSRSVAVGRRSYSGYFWENGGGGVHDDLKPGGGGGGGNGNIYCTPARAQEVEVKGSNRGGEEISISQPPRRSGRGWSWAFASPMRVFKHSKALKSSVATNNPPPCSAAEMCRG